MDAYSLDLLNTLAELTDDRWVRALYQLDEWTRAAMKANLV